MPIDITKEDWKELKVAIVRGIKQAQETERCEKLRKQLTEANKRAERCYNAWFDLSHADTTIKKLQARVLELENLIEGAVLALNDNAAGLAILILKGEREFKK